MTLPPLPKQTIRLEWNVQMPSGKTLNLYSKEDADDFNAMLAAVRDAALEEAAKVCDELGEAFERKQCAAAIRALKEKE